MSVCRAGIKSERPADFALGVWHPARVEKRKRVQVRSVDRIGLPLGQLSKRLSGLGPALEFKVSEPHVLPGAKQRRVAMHRLPKISNGRFEIVPVSTEKRTQVEHPCV